MKKFRNYHFGLTNSKKSFMNYHVLDLFYLYIPKNILLNQLRSAWKLELIIFRMCMDIETCPMMTNTKIRKRDAVASLFYMSSCFNVKQSFLMPLKSVVSDESFIWTNTQQLLQTLKCGLIRPSEWYFICSVGKTNTSVASNYIKNQK